MINAGDAKQRTDEKYADSLTIILAEISKDIEKQIEQGKYSIMYQNAKHTNKKLAIDYLRTIGYEVVVYDDYQGFSMKISWELK